MGHPNNKTGESSQNISAAGVDKQCKVVLKRVEVPEGGVVRLHSGSFDPLPTTISKRKTENILETAIKNSIKRTSNMQSCTNDSATNSNNKSEAKTTVNDVIRSGVKAVIKNGTKNNKVGSGNILRDIVRSQTLNLNKDNVQNVIKINNDSVKKAATDNKKFNGGGNAVENGSDKSEPSVNDSKKSIIINSAMTRLNEAFTPTRISARLKNQKVKFSVKRLLAGLSEDEDDLESPPAKTPRKAGSVAKATPSTRTTPLAETSPVAKSTPASSAKANSMSHLIALPKTSQAKPPGSIIVVKGPSPAVKLESPQLLTAIIAAKKKKELKRLLKESKLKLKQERIRVIDNAGAPISSHISEFVELGPEITITRVKSSKSGSGAQEDGREATVRLPTPPPSEDVTITESKVPQCREASPEEVRSSKSSLAPTPKNKVTGVMTRKTGKKKEAKVKHKFKKKMLPKKNTLNISKNDSIKISPVRSGSEKPRKEIEDIVTITIADSNDEPSRRKGEEKAEMEVVSFVEEVQEAEEIMEVEKEVGVEKPVEENKAKSKQNKKEKTKAAIEKVEETVEGSRSSGGGAVQGAWESKREKKTAKVTPLTQVRGHHKVEPIQEQHYKAYKTQPQQKPKGSGQLKRKAVDNFEKYFITKTRICEHNDSLESDSGEEPDRLSHFINMKKNETFPPSNIIEKVAEVQAEGTPNEMSSIYDLMQEIALEMPAWNLHILEDTESFCIAHVARGPVGIPVIKKIIEIDNDYNAKVYVNQAFRSEYRGVYDSYESMKQLIYTVDKL